MMKKIERSVFMLAFLLTTTLSSGINATENIRSIYSISGYYLGVVSSGNLFCYEINNENKWVKCKKWSPIPIPNDIVFISDNSRRIALAQKEKIRYYDQEGRLYGSCSHVMPSNLNHDSQVFRNSNATECEIFVRDKDYFYIYGTDRSSKEKAAKIKFTCSEIDQSSDVFWYDVKWRVAVIKDNSVKIYRVYRVDETGKSNDLSCLAEPEKTLYFDTPQDEIAVISSGTIEYGAAGGGVIASRKGDVINFFSYDQKSKSWRKAKSQPDSSQEAPGFVLYGQQ